MRRPVYLRMCADRLQERIRMARLIAHLKGVRKGARWLLLGGLTPWD